MENANRKAEEGGHDRGSGDIHLGRVNLFEPIRGSAPEHVGEYVTRSFVAILDAGMMLGHVGRRAIELTMGDVRRSGRPRGLSTCSLPTDRVGKTTTVEMFLITAATP